MDQEVGVENKEENESCLDATDNSIQVVIFKKMLLKKIGVMLMTVPRMTISAVKTVRSKRMKQSFNLALNLTKIKIVMPCHIVHGHEIFLTDYAARIKRYL